jgi:hypothetical protein
MVNLWKRHVIWFFKNVLADVNEFSRAADAFELYVLEFILDGVIHS